MNDNNKISDISENDLIYKNNDIATNLNEDLNIKKKSFLKKFGSSISFFIITFIIFILVTLGIGSLTKHIFLKELFDNSLYLQLSITVLVSYLVGVFLPSYIYQKIKKLSIPLKLNFKNIILCILLGIMVQPIGMVLSLLGSIFVESNVVTDTVTIYKTLHPFFIIFFFAVLPAIIEEYMFRGIMLNDTKDKISFLKASVFTSICFGIMHLNVQQFIYAVALGIFFCYVYRKTNSLLSTMIIHFTINGSQLLLSLKLLTNEAYDASTQTKLSVSDTLTAFCIMCITVVPIFYAICMWLYKLLDSPKNNN